MNNTSYHLCRHLGRKKRRDSAEERKFIRLKRSVERQLEILEDRPGESKKERTRLEGLFERTI